MTDFPIPHAFVIVLSALTSLSVATGTIAQKTGPDRRLPPIIVVGSSSLAGVPRVPLDSIGSRDVLGPEQVDAIRSRDLNDLVQHLPALSSRPYNGGEAAAPSFSMRGLPDDGLTEYVHILIDGVPASPMPYGWTAFSFLPLTTERVYAMDYIRGGHAVRYSPNTVGGVLNLITRPIPETRAFTTRATFGSHDYASTMVMAGDRGADVGVALTYVDRRGDGYRRDGGFDQQEVNVKLRFETGEDSWITSSLTYMEDEHQAPGGLTRAQFAVDRFANVRPENRFEGLRQVVDVVAHSDLGRDSWAEWYGYASETFRHLRARRPHLGAAVTISDWQDRSYFAGVGVRSASAVRGVGVDHRIFWGVRAQREWIPHWKLRSEALAGGTSTLTQDARYWLQTVSAHVDDTIEVAPGVTVHAGARVEWVPKAVGEDPIGGWRYDDDYFAVLPGGGFAYALSEDLAVFGNYFESFRAPQVWGFASTVPNPALDFEAGRAFELGVRFVECAGLSGSLTGWRTTYDDFGVFYSGSYENLGKIVARGADLQLNWDAGASVQALRGLTVSGSVTMQESELRSGPDRGKETPYAWGQKAAWRLGYEVESGWGISIGGVHVGDSFADSANTSVSSADGMLGRNPSWTIWDARIAKTLDASADEGDVDVEFAVGITNLFDREWSVHSRGGFFGGGQVSGPPRAFYISMGVDW